MVVSDPFQGTITLSATFQTIYNELPQTGEKAFWLEGWVDLSEMTAGDTVEIKIYNYYNLGQVYRCYAHAVLYGDQSPIESHHVGGILSRSHKIEISQTNTNPTFKTISYEFFQVNKE